MITGTAAVGACLSIFLLLILGAKRPKARPDRWLATWLTAQALFTAGIALSPALPSGFALPVLVAGQCMLLLLGPAQYLYAAAALDAQAHHARHVAAHATGGLVLTAPLLAGAEAEAGAILVRESSAWLLLIPIGGPLLAALYPLAVLRLIARRRAALQDHLSNLSATDLGWLSIWSWTSLAVLLGLAFAAATSAFLGWSVSVQMTFVLGLLAANIAYVGFTGVTRPGILVASAPPQIIPSADPVDLAQAAEDFASVDKVLRETKPYLRDDLTASDLAEALGWAPERLSKSLRHGGGLSFFDAINAARVREVQELARESRNARVSLLALAHDAGFGSKTAFYNAFQRHVGCSPAAWRRNEAQD